MFPIHVAWRARLLALWWLLAHAMAPVTQATILEEIARYSLGDDDAGAAHQKPITLSRDLVSGLDVHALKSPTYSFDAPVEAGQISGGVLSAKFNGVDQALTRPLIDIGTEFFGLELWVKPRSAQGTRAIVYNGDTRGSGWGLYQYNGAFAILYGGVKLSTGGEVKPDVWTHVAFVYSTKLTQLFINGKSIASIPDLVPRRPTSGGFAIGCPGQGGATEFFDGSIDDVRIFTHTGDTFDPNDLLYFSRRPQLQVFAPEEISATSMALVGTVTPFGLPTVAWFEYGLGGTFDHRTPEQSILLQKPQLLLRSPINSLLPGAAYDVRLVASNRAGRTFAALGSVSTLAPDGFQDALRLDGKQQYVQVPGGSFFGSEFTIESWVRIRKNQSWARLLDFGNGPANDNVLLALSEADTGKPALVIYNGNVMSIARVPVTIPTNQWVHVAATFSEGTARFYMNGELVSEVGGMPSPRPVERNQNFIGRSNWANDALADADLDEFRIWSRARTQLEIQAAMGRELSGAEAGLALYYRFDEAPLGGAIRDSIALEPRHPAATPFGGEFIGSLPIPLPLPAENVVPEAPSPTSLKVQLTVPPWYLQGTAWVAWGDNSSAEKVSSPIAFDSRSGTANLTFNLTGLQPYTRYQLRVGLTNQFGLARSDAIDFSTASLVTNASDAGPGSLRDALQTTVSRGKIEFSPNVRGTIALTSGALTVNRSVRIAGPGAGALALSGSVNSRVFVVRNGLVEIEGLTIRDGYPGDVLNDDYEHLYGGAILNNAQLQIANCLFKQNIGGYGAAIANVGVSNRATVTVSGSTFTENFAAAGGNAIANLNLLSSNPTLHRVEIQRCTFSGNVDWNTQFDHPRQPQPTVDLVTQHLGGALYNQYGQMLVNESTITRNHTELGGGVFNIGGYVTLHSSIVAENSAVSFGPDIEAITTDPVFGDYLPSPVVDGGFNLIGDISSFGGGIQIDGLAGSIFGNHQSPIRPLLGPLSDNGGPTPTHALLPNSPAIDAGDAITAGVDQRGLPRPSGLRADIGAFELQTAIQTTTPVITFRANRPLKTIELFFNGTSGTTYQVQSTETPDGGDAARWTTLGLAIEVDPGGFLFETPHSPVEPQRYYRVMANQ